MSLEVSSTASSSSTSGVSPVPVANKESHFSSLQEIVDKCLSSLDSIKPEDTEGPHDLQQAKNSVCEFLTLLYLDNV